MLSENNLKITNFLIIPRPHIGDFIWATSAAALLKKFDKTAEITVIVPENLKEFIIGNFIFDETYYYNLNFFESQNIFTKIFYRLFLFMKSVILLRKKKFDACFLFNPFTLFIKISAFLKIKDFIFSAYECCGYAKTSKELSILKKFKPAEKLFPIETPKDADRVHRSYIYQMLVRKYLNFPAASLPVLPETGNDYAKIEAPIKTKKLKKIAICMQPSKSSKNVWPLEYFAETINEISKRFSAAFFVVGSNEDENKTFKPLLDKMDKNTEIKNLMGQTSLLELKDFLGKCDLLISVDTGTMHVAATTKTNIISLFGMTHPDSVIPMTPRNMSLYAGAECSPCIYKLSFEKYKCPYGNNPKCMEMIKPEDVIKCAVKILEQK